MTSPSEPLSPHAGRREAEYFPPLPSHPDFIGPTAYAEHIALSHGTVPEPAPPVLHENAAVAPSTEVPSLIYERVSGTDSVESIASCVTQVDEEIYLPLLQYEINAAYIELYANTHDAAPYLEESFRYTIPTIILGYLRQKYDAERAAGGIIQRVIEGAISWRKGASKHARCDDADKEAEHAKDRPGSTPTATAPAGDQQHWSSKDPLGALEYMFDLAVRIATLFPWAAAKGEAGHHMLVELIFSAKEILEKICSKEEKEKDKQAGVKVEWKDEIRDAFSRTLVTVLNRHWIVRMPAESVVPGHEETVNFASFLSFLVARFPCPRSTAYSKMFLSSGRLMDSSGARELPLSEGDFAPLDLLYTLMKHDLESFYCAQLVKAQSSKQNFKLAMTCAMYLMLAVHRLWEYYILNGRESDWTEKDPEARVTTATTDRQAAQEIGKAHWHNWMSAMYSISHDEDADVLVRGAAVQAVRNMGYLVTRLAQHQELERIEGEAEAGAEAEAEEEAETEAETEAEAEAEAETETETEVEAALATKSKIQK